MGPFDYSIFRVLKKGLGNFSMGSCFLHEVTEDAKTLGNYESAENSGILPLQTRRAREAIMRQVLLYPGEDGYWVAEVHFSRQNS